MIEQKILEIMQENKKYKDLEEELGIDLITLFKTLKDGIYYKTIRGKVYNISHWCLTLNYTDTYELWVENHKELDGLLIHLKDYKKTWWLKEDLENGEKCE